MLETNIGPDIDDLDGVIKLEEPGLNLLKGPDLQIDLRDQLEELFGVGLGYKMIFADLASGQVHFARRIDPSQAENYPRYHIVLGVNNDNFESLSLHSDDQPHHTGDGLCAEEWERIASRTEEYEIFQANLMGREMVRITQLGSFLARVASSFSYSSLDFNSGKFRLSRDFDNCQRLRLWVELKDRITPESITVVRQDASRWFTLDADVLDEGDRLIEIAKHDPLFRKGLGKQLLTALMYNRTFPNKNGIAQAYLDNLSSEDSVPMRVVRERMRKASRDGPFELSSYGESISS